MSFDLHRHFQDLMRDKADIMCGYQISRGERESRTHIQVDYFCIADRERPHFEGKEGIRPFSDFSRFNVIELEGLGRTLSEGRFRYHLGRALVMENPAGKPCRRKETTLTIIVVHQPVKLLRNNRYSFERLAPWKYRTTFLCDLPVTIIILRELQRVDGGEPLAWLQLLEPDQRRRPAVWSRILTQKMTGQDQMKSHMMEMDKEAYMTIAEELRNEGWQQGEISGIRKAKAEIGRNMLQNGCNLSLILKVTGLSPTQVDALRQELE